MAPIFDEGLWESQYAECLVPPWWRGRRNRALALAGHCCQRPGCESTDNLNVHHFSYERLYGELDEDLVVLCRYHHEAIHRQPVADTPSTTVLHPDSREAKVRRREHVNPAFTRESLAEPAPVWSPPVERSGRSRVGWIIGAVFVIVLISMSSRAHGRGGAPTRTPTRVPVSVVLPTPAFGAQTVVALRVANVKAAAATFSARGNSGGVDVTPSASPLALEPAAAPSPASGTSSTFAVPSVPDSCTAVRGQCTDVLRITTPQDGAVVQGSVPIAGTALGGQFYKIEVSGAECPADGEWSSISDVHTAMVADGLLDNWQTGRHPSGWYWLKLTVVLPDGNYPPPCVIRAQVGTEARSETTLPASSADTSGRWVPVPAGTTSTGAPRFEFVFVPDGATPPPLPRGAPSLDFVKTPAAVSPTWPAIATTQPTVSACPGGCTTHVAGCDIKGNVAYESGERIYHVRGQEYYAETKINAAYGERWFCTEQEAQEAGWRKPYR